MNRPWATALSRLLQQRHLAKGELADLADVRAGTISAVANSPKMPDVKTLQRLADGFTKHDRTENPHAPAVELWEFFVSDEQAALLHQSAQKRQQLVKQEELADIVIRQLTPLIAPAIAAAVASTGQTAQQPAVAPGSASKGSSPRAESVARGKLQRPA